MEAWGRAVVAGAGPSLQETNGAARMASNERQPGAAEAPERSSASAMLRMDGAGSTGAHLYGRVRRGRHRGLRAEAGHGAPARAAVDVTCLRQQVHASLSGILQRCNQAPVCEAWEQAWRLQLPGWVPGAPGSRLSAAGSQPWQRCTQRPAAAAAEPSACVIAFTARHPWSHPRMGACLGPRACTNQCSSP